MSEELKKAAITAVREISQLLARNDGRCDDVEAEQIILKHVSPLLSPAQPSGEGLELDSRDKVKDGEWYWATTPKGLVIRQRRDDPTFAGIDDEVAYVGLLKSDANTFANAGRVCAFHNLHQDLADSKQLLGNLLARIFRDGGQRQAAIGDDKRAVVEADEVLCDLMNGHADAKRTIGEMREALIDSRMESLQELLPERTPAQYYRRAVGEIDEQFPTAAALAANREAADGGEEVQG